MKMLYFASAAEATGCREEDIPLPHPMSGAEVWDALVARHPRLAPLRAVARLARNEEYAAEDDQFSDADRLAVIPPVSGG